MKPSGRGIRCRRSRSLRTLRAAAPCDALTVRLVFAGTPAAALPSLDALLDVPHDVVAVVTRPDAAAGRGRQVAQSPVKQRALEAGIEVLTPAHPSDPGFLERLRQLEPDCIPVVAYGALVPADALEIPDHGWVNLHFSLLPAWRGAAPVQHAILGGDSHTGATTFLLDDGLDTGPLFGSLTTAIGDRETAGELLDRLALAGAALLAATVDGIESGGVAPEPQPNTGVSHAPKLTATDARVDWHAPALRVDRLVRACTPAPGPWTTFRGKRLGLGPVRPRSSPGGLTLAPGQLLDLGKDGIAVGTGGGYVELGEVRPEGKASMWCDAWARGVRLTADDRLE